MMNLPDCVVHYVAGTPDMLMISPYQYGAVRFRLKSLDIHTLVAQAK